MPERTLFERVSNRVLTPPAKLIFRAVGFTPDETRLLFDGDFDGYRQLQGSQSGESCVTDREQADGVCGDQL